tara:strand:+ start:467 stop:1648 length:1182 start_codon:yes stop_codon:yes gene_type:complete
MSGNELIGKEELDSIKDIFIKSNGVLFSHSFSERRNNIYRVEIFEKLFAKKNGSKYAVACSSGTAAGAISLIAAGVKPGDEVITQAFTFIAPIESIMSIGAIPKVIDIDKSLNMCPDKLRKSITKKTKCIMPVHMLGVPAKMDEIISIAKSKNIPVIEDACESLGACFKNKKTGSIGLSGFFSLDFGKVITTGEGGIVCTNSKKQYLLLKSLRDHGHINKPGVHRGLDKALLRGFNYRMTELQAAVGIAQLKKLNLILKKKKINRKILYNILKKNKFVEFRKLNDYSSNGDQNDHLIIYVKNNKIAKKIKIILDKKNIPTGVLPIATKWHYAAHWNHIWKEKKTLNKYRKKNFWKVAESLIPRSLSFPISIKISKKDLMLRAKLISRIIEKNY